MSLKKLLIFIVASILPASCGGTTGDSSAIDSISSSTIGLASSSSAETLLEFSEAKYDSMSVVFDGEAHTIVVTGIPEGTAIVYQDNGPFTNVGEYPMSVTLSKTGYKETVLNATLEITKATFSSSISLSNQTIEYDETDHINDVRVSGTLPEGSSVSYIVKNETNQTVASAVEVGKYFFTATVIRQNYNDLVLSAVLTIKAVQDPLPIAVKDGVVYFANGLDENGLYYYDQNATNPLASFLSAQTVDDFFFHGSKLAMFNNSLFIGSVSSVTTTEVSSLLSTGLYNYVTSDGNFLYYSKNGITQEQSGIYRVDISGEEPIETQIYSGKSYYLQCSSGNVYFADGRNGKKLSYVSSSLLAAASTANLISTSGEPDGFTIKSLMEDNGILYFDVNNLLGDYIGKVDLAASSYKKLTSTQGKYLTVIGNYLYFSNNDLITEALSGKGIFRVPTSGGSIEKVVAEENGINYLTYDASNNSMIYTRSSDLHVIRRNLGTGVETDLLSGFVPIEHTPLNTGGRSVVHGNYLYFLDIYHGKTLARYDGADVQRLTSNKVTDFSIIGDNLYFNQVNNLVNNDLFMVDLKTSGVPQKISSDDLSDLVSDGTYLYAAKSNASGAATSMVRMALDGSSPVEFFSKGAKNLRIHDGLLYFLNGDKIYTIATSNINQSSSDMTAAYVDLSGNESIDHFEINDHSLVYDFGGLITNKIAEAPINDPLNETILASNATNPIDFIIVGTDVYYYSYVKSSGGGAFFKVNVNATGDGTAVKLYDKTSDGTQMYGRDLAYLDGKLFFLNYYSTMALGNAHTYYLDLSNLNADPIEIS